MEQRESVLLVVLSLCRAINYDEKDPFLCNSCGFSKYAKFELTVEAKACSAVNPIENEDDRKKVGLILCSDKQWYIFFPPDHSPHQSASGAG